MQDAAYETLLHSQRQSLHPRIAESMRDKFPAVAKSEPELVAQHFTRAGLTESPSSGGRRPASSRARFPPTLKRLRTTARRSHSRIICRPTSRDWISDSGCKVSYRQTLYAARGPGASETVAAFARARELASAIENPAERAPVYYGLWYANIAHGEIIAARELAELFLHDAQYQSSSPEAGVAHRVIGITAYMEGKLAEACSQLERAMGIFESVTDRALQLHFGQDLGVATMNALALVLWQMGEVRRACKLADDGLAFAVESRHFPTLIWAYHYNCLFEGQRRDVARAKLRAEALVNLSLEHFPKSDWEAWGPSCWAGCDAYQAIETVEQPTCSKASRFCASIRCSFI